MGQFEQACAERNIELIIVLSPARSKYNGGVKRAFREDGMN